MSKPLLPFSFFKKNSEVKEVIKSLGVVFGDIGTSPLYTLSSIFAFLQPTRANILGVISLIIWTLILVVFVEYAILAMSLGKKGEGGTIVLKELLSILLKKPIQLTIVTILSFIGISLFIGDGVITPAVSILSAVEGIILLPGFHNVTRGSIFLIMVAAIICVFLFIFQKKGTGTVGLAFGPLMVLWFSSIFTFGFISLFNDFSVLKAMNPYYAIKFLIDHGWSSFFVLSAVILCATGGEALYADMGHLGRKPILQAWYFVFISLIFCYLGQGAFLMAHPNAKQVFYEMIFSITSSFYFPFLILSVMATVIASQALISGVFSIVFQGISTHILPLFKVDYTSSRLRSQVYIGIVNWLLLASVLFMIFNFKKSENLTAAYGLAVSGTMAITGIMMTWLFYRRKKYFKTAISVCLAFINLAFLVSTTLKIPAGGYWSIVFALIPLSVILIYTSGQKKMHKMQEPMPLDEFLNQYSQIYKVAPKIEGSALFFSRDVKNIQSFIVRTIFENKIIYQDNIIVSVITRDDPFGVIGLFKGSLAKGLRIFEIHRGYMEVLDIQKVLINSGIESHAIFYGIEEIVTKNIVWKIYALIKRLCPTFVQFYKLPYDKIHGVVSMVEI